MQDTAQHLDKSQDSKSAAQNLQSIATTHQDINQAIAQELSISQAQVEATVAMLDDGATVPFIARYRKDKTKGLDDAQLRKLEERLTYLRDMSARRAKILEMLESQGNLTEALKARIEAAASKLELEDIYLPYRPRRTSKAQKARDAGLGDLALNILTEVVEPASVLEGFEPVGELADNYRELEPQLEAMQYVIMEKWSEDLALLDDLRESFSKVALIQSKVASEEKRDVGEKFKDYFEHSESLTKLPAHRLLAMLRGRQENVLMLKIVGMEGAGDDVVFVEKIINNFELNAIEPAARQTYLKDTAKKLWLEKYRPHIEHRLLTEKRLAAEEDAIDVFGENLRHLLMAAPAGGRVILGVDPGIRHGVKMAVVDATGAVASQQSTDHDPEANPEDDSEASQESNLEAFATVYPFAPDNKRSEAIDTIKQLCETHHVDIVAIGNGTASRETDALVAEVKRKHPELGFTQVVVNESGASVYSASELASLELAELDVSIRGAVSIARRLQDPLSELVKVDPKAIGVGQYQHDVNQNKLGDKLNIVTQDCVNAVGVDVNTASPAILTHIAGLNANVAQQIYAYRRENGAFTARKELMNVPRLGARTFEQAAGFLRIRDAQNKLETTGVHPESYVLVDDILAKAGKTLEEVLGVKGALEGVNPEDFVTEQAGVEMVRAVIAELEKPAHDPRPEFKTATFKEGVNDIKDLQPDMSLQGVVTNVTHFGAFVDVGVHQDGLVHISQMANKFVEDPMNLVKVGDIVTVRVLEVDTERGRISFTMKTDKTAGTAGKPKAQPRYNGKSSSKGSGGDNASGRGNASEHSNHKSRGGKGAHQGKKGGQKSRGDTPAKMGSLGALLAEAGLKKSK